MQIGFIGCGHMGSPMVRNLLQAGHQVMVYDVVTQAAANLVADGATLADSVASLAKHSDVVFTMLQTGEQVSAVCLGDEGIFANANDGLLYIDSSSIDVTTSRQLHQQAESKNIAMLDAPVSGGVIGAEAASLTIMVGGSVEIFTQAQPLLAVLGKNIIHAGPAGNGQAAKICNNMILGISMIAISEAFNLGEALGLDPQTLFDISSKSSGQCWSLTSYAPVPGLVPAAPANNDFEPGFTGAMMLKDLHLSQLAASDSNTRTPLGKHATELYEKFVNNGYANKDFSAIIKLLAD